MKKRKDGRYQKKVTLSDGRQKLVYGRTIAEANQAADQLLQAVNERSYNDAMLDGLANTIKENAAKLNQE